MEECEQVAQKPCKQDDLCCKQLEVGGSSFSATFISRNMDCSFGDGQLEQSPAFTCKSSFSAFLADDGTPCSGYGGFSFSSCCKSSVADFSSPIPSMPSFSFFSPISAVEQGNASLGHKVNMTKLDEKHGGIYVHMIPCHRFCKGPLHSLIVKFGTKYLGSCLELIVHNHIALIKYKIERI